MLAKKESDPVDGHAGLRKLIKRGRFMRTRLMESKRITLDKQWPCHGWIHASTSSGEDWTGMDCIDLHRGSPTGLVPTST